MRQLSMTAAIREALNKLMRENRECLLLGEDIGVYGGAFKTTEGIVDEFGPDRVINTPISEAGFVSMAVGAAMAGSRPIVEIMFMDFMLLALDSIVNVAVKWREIYGAAFRIPLIIRTPAGAGRSYGPTHSQSFEGMLMNVPGLCLCCPSTPADAAGLLLGAYQSERTVILIEPKALYARKGPVPEELQLVPLGKAVCRRPGHDLTIITYGRQVPAVLKAAGELAAQGVEAEVIDLRTIKPLDVQMICESVFRTGRAMTVEESPVIGGVGSEIAAVVFEQCFDYLEAPFARLGAAERPIECAPALEAACFPIVTDITRKALAIAQY